MSIIDDIEEAAKKSKNSAPEQDNKILRFTNSYTVQYRAFYAPSNEGLVRLEIQANQMYVMPRYDLLYDIIHTGAGDFVGLIYPHMQVKMFGRNLNPLIKALFTNSVEWVREYDPPFFEFSEDDDVATLPCIEQIIIENHQLDPEAEIKARDARLNPKQ